MSYLLRYDLCRNFLEQIANLHPKLKKKNGQFYLKGEVKRILEHPGFTL